MKKDIAVTLSNGILTIKGVKKQNEENTRTFRRKSYGASSGPCSYRTQSRLTRSKPSSTKGVLKITAAKKYEAVKAQRKIEIQKVILG